MRGVELEHKACASLLMEDFGVDKKLEGKFVEEIERIWDSERMAHALIVASVNRWRPHPITRSLESLLESHKTKEPRHRKP